MADDALSAADHAAVLHQVRRCLRTCVGGSGHLTALHVRPETFRILHHETLDDGTTAYTFEGQADREAEHLPEDTDPDLATTPIAGRIILDADLALTRDEEGRVRLEPYKVLDPDDVDREAEDSMQDLLDDVLGEDGS